jgi:hypothetical protein
MSLRIVDPQFAKPIRPEVPCTDCREKGDTKSNRGRSALESQGAPKTRELRAAQRSLQTQQSAQLEIKTQDGDTVTLSFASRSLEQSQSIRTPKGYAESQQSSSSFEFNLSIEGNLSDAEVADIKKVIEGLNNPAQLSEDLASSDLGSLESYSYAYQRSSTFSASTLSYSA